MKSIFDLNMKNMIPWSWMCVAQVLYLHLCVCIKKWKCQEFVAIPHFVSLREDRNGEGNHSLVESGRIASFAHI